MGKHLCLSDYKSKYCTILSSNIVVLLFFLISIFVNLIKITASMIIKFVVNDLANTKCS